MKAFPAKSLPMLAAPLMLMACATIAPPQPPSLDLPKPPSDLRAVRKGNHVTLRWSIPIITTDRQTIRRFGATRVCRGTEDKLSDCGTPVAEVPGRASLRTPASQSSAQTYTDTLSEQTESDDPSALLTYAVEVVNTAGRSAALSNEVHVSRARTLAPPQDLAARVIETGVALTWTNNVADVRRNSAIHYEYRVYRRQEGGSERVLVGKATAGSQREVSLTDPSIEWQKTYLYYAQTVTLIDRENQQLEIEGDDSPEVKVFVNDVFPPAVPSGLQAVASGPGQSSFIDLVWAPVSDVDLDGYNVYRREESNGAVKINTELVKTPAYRDGSVVAGRRYFYSVSAVDVHGNESARSDEASETAPAGPQ